MPQELIDSYGHDITYQQVVPQNNPTIANPGTADPTGTTATSPGQVSDGVGLFQITTAGTQATGALRTITFNKPYECLRSVVAAVVSTLAGVAAGGTITTTLTVSSLSISVGTALTTATTYQIYYKIS
jgi:hypothetical protein